MSQFPNSTNILTQPVNLNQSLAADFEGYPIDVSGFDIGSIQIIWSGADATDGEFYPQGSNDKKNWCNLVKATQVEKTANPACNVLYEITDISFHYLRINYVANNVSAGTISQILYHLKRRRN